MTVSILLENPRLNSCNVHRRLVKYSQGEDVWMFTCGLANWNSIMRDASTEHMLEFWVERIMDTSYAAQKFEQSIAF
jgi:hypothetical protein